MEVATNNTLDGGPETPPSRADLRALAAAACLAAGEIPEREGLLLFSGIARKHRGEYPVMVMVMASGRKYRLNYDMWVDPTEEFRSAIAGAFGENSIIN